jgi:uroporphyrinogen III methyltransferase/synthase
VEAYETVVPQRSRRLLQAALKYRRPHVVTFTSSSTVRNFMELLKPLAKNSRNVGLFPSRHKDLVGIKMASIGPVTASTLREFGLPVDISAKDFTIPGLIQAIIAAIANRSN